MGLSPGLEKSLSQDLKDAREHIAGSSIHFGTQTASVHKTHSIPARLINGLATEPSLKWADKKEAYLCLQQVRLN